LVSSLKLVWNALTRIFGAISQATGGAMMTPSQVITGAAVGGIGAAAAVATGGGSLALMGAAMTGMSASGVGGSAMGMAGGQLMMAGRMASMSGARRMVETGHRDSAPPASDIAPNEITATPLLSSGEMSQAASAQMQALPAQTIPAFANADVEPDSSLGRRTSRIEGRFTPLDEAALPLTARQAQHLMHSDDTRDDVALRSTFQSDNARDEHVAQALMGADNTRDDAALRETLKTTPQTQPLDTSSLERAGRDLTVAANSLKTTAQQQHQDRVMGRLDVSGSRNTGAVVADALDLERDYRQKLSKPMLEGAGETFSGRMTQAVGMQPIAGQAPITDAARFNAVGVGALRLGLNGDQLMQVLKEQSASADGRSISPELQEKLVTHVRQATGARQQTAQQRVSQFLNVTAAMPEAVRITGKIDGSRVTQEQADEN
jgi:hypothetical protein